MSGVNKVILVGNLGRDPEVRTFDGDNKKATFTLATSESYKNRAGERVTNTEWHNVVLWGALAAIAERFLSKGKQVYVEGKLTHRSYEDKEGNTRYITEVVGRQMTLLGGRREGEDSGYASHSEGGYSTPQGAGYSEEVPAGGGGAVDDLPF